MVLCDTWDHHLGKPIYLEISLNVFSDTCFQISMQAVVFTSHTACAADLTDQLEEFRRSRYASEDGEESRQIVCELAFCSESGIFRVRK